MASVSPDARVLLEYVSPHGAKVTHLRGVLLVNAIENLERWGVYQRYLESLSEGERNWLVSALATSWVPIDAGERHYELVSRLEISDRSFDEAGALMADRVAEMYLSGALHKSVGIEGFAALLARNDKMWERFYQGGACVARRLGRDEFALEDRGNPLVRHRAFRIAYLGYMRALANRFREGVEIQEKHPAAGSEPLMVTLFRW